MSTGLSLFIMMILHNLYLMILTVIREVIIQEALIPINQQQVNLTVPRNQINSPFNPGHCQPFAGYLGRALEHQYKREGVFAYSRYTFSPGQRKFLYDFLRYHDPSRFRRLMPLGHGLVILINITYNIAKI